MTLPASDIPIIVLAAGQSSRMRGDDKLLQMVDGKPLIRRQAELARDATTGPVIVTLPEKPHPRYRALSGLDVLALPVPDATEGMNASLRAGIKALPAGSPAVLVLLGDLPELICEDLKTVLHSIDTDNEFLIWRGATESGKPGHPVMFSANLFDRITQLEGDSGGRELVAAAGDRVKLVHLAGERARLDLDTPEDWANWRANQSGGN